MTKRNRHPSIWVGLVGVLILLAMTPATWAQESGAEMWGRACARCHRAQPPNKYDADTWRAIMRNMALNARLTPQEEIAITEFLVGTARPLTAVLESRPDGAQLAHVVSVDPDVLFMALSSRDSARGPAVYRAQCRVCHGEEAKGNGPAAAALTPRPPDLTRSERVRTMSDEELLEFLSVGKGSMPGFGKILTQQELRDVVAWLQTMNNVNR
jgi:mono/diheme cytochrome c family protein